MEGASRLRLVLLASFVGLVAVAVGVRLYQIQAVMSERFQIRAADQHESRRKVPAVRGSILDRQGRALAASVETRALYAHPNRVEDAASAVEQLAPVLGRSRAELMELLDPKDNFVYLDRFLEPEQIEAIRELDLPLGGSQPFGFETTDERVYPNGRLAVHVVGFANIDGDGVEGIEKIFDEELKGDPEVFLVLQDAHRGEVQKLVHPAEKKPRDVVLTLDLVLQHVVERELDEAMRKTGARAASGVILDPTTGQVLALANRPAADLSRYSQASGSQKVNRALVHVYEPGSTFKIVTMSTALSRGRARPNQRVFCENGLYRKSKRDIHDIGRYGSLTLRGVLEKSSNIGMVKVAEKVSAEEMYESITDFGFGSKTGIELPGECVGLLTPLEKWNEYTRDSVAFGHEIAVTVLQMTSAFGAIANGGVLVPPRVVLGTRERGRELLRAEPPSSRTVITPEAARQMNAMLEGVIESGTGTRASVAGYRIAGKSGTAQLKRSGSTYSKTEFMASFGGFGPVGEPRVAILVVLDSPRGKEHGGGEVAAPVFGRIMEQTLRHLRVPAGTDPSSSSLLAQEQGDFRIPPRWGDERAEPGVVPDLRGMSLRDAVATLAAHGYGASVSGNGFVTSQQPAAGEALPPGGVCAVRLAETAQQRVAYRQPARGRKPS